MSWPFETWIQKGHPGVSSLELFLDYLGQTGVSLYEAQEEAMLELSAGANVILNTPTGSGKSLVATFLHFDAIRRGSRSVYTSPIKALVNEKFLGLCREFGPERVGMITGDASVNADAPIICCTAEILSQMALRLGEQTPFQEVVMDEFHYYADRERGSAWQIPLITLPRARFLLMSATLGDTGFFEEALTRLNGRPTVKVKSGVRPVPLEFEYSERPLHFKIADLITGGRYPVYLVNFTQRECAEEAQNLLSVDFCTKDEKRKIAEALEGVRFNSPYGKEVQRLLKHGVGIHHGGLLPRYRVAVERLAQLGLLKVICGTDTLGVGVNVPIRTVLFTRLSKFDGEKVALLTVRDFQQISGRAGRKGFDDRGWVVVQAPEHVIENRVLDEKAAQDPKFAKKRVKRKPPEKGFVPWSADTLNRLREGMPEPLVSRFKVDHALVLNVLSRPGTQNCGELRKIISSSHDSEVQKKRHQKQAFQLFRSLYERGIIELSPLRLQVDLQNDFSLNHGLALFLVDTLGNLDAASPDYALDVLTLAESIVEDPDLILRRQVDRLKTLRMEELKRSGMEYEDRIAELEKIEHPKPRRDFIYDQFNAFSRLHPWVGEENIRPKSVAREMIETYQSFHEYIREYGLERVEGQLLRYISEVYKILVRTVPGPAKTESVLELIDYFSEMLRTIDSSLVEEWEKLRRGTPALQAPTEDKVSEALVQSESERLAHQRAALRNAVFRWIRDQIRQDSEEARPEWVEYQAEHEGPLLDQKARSGQYTRIEFQDNRKFKIIQSLHDREDFDDWCVEFEAEFNGNEVHLVPLYLGPIR